MLRPLYRRLALGAVALTCAGALTAPASAGGLVRIQNTIDDFSCTFATEEGPTVYFFGSASSADSGSAAFVEGDDLYLEGWGGSAQFGAGSLTASVRIGVPEEPTTGVIRLSAATALGPATVERVDERSGNSWTKGTVTTADYRFSDVAVTVDGFTPIVEPSSCVGQRSIFDVRSSNPAAAVHRDTILDSEPCAIDGIADASLLLSGQPKAPYLEVVSGAEGPDPRKAQGPLQRARGDWHGSFPVIALATEEQVGTLDVSAQLTPSGPPLRQRVVEGGIAEMTWVVPLSATYRLTASDGSVGTAQCTAREVRTHLKVSPHAG